MSSREERQVFAGLVLFCLISVAAMTFQGGQIPHWIDIGNGETVVAYANGVVYTNPPDAGALWGKRTLWQAGDGTIMSSFSVIGPSFGFYEAPSIPATLEEVAKWKKAQVLLAKRIR